MDAKMDSKELISALADGQLRGDELAQAMDAVCADRSARETWHAYHVIGDVLRSTELGGGAPAPQFLDKLSARLAQEQVHRPAPLPPIPVSPRVEAANDGSFRWKVVAGVASVAAMAAIGWSAVGQGPSAQSQLAGAGAAGSPVGAETVLTRSEAGVMIRDPKLDELLAAHRQFGSASALHTPAGFLRSATFDGPSR